MGILDKARQAAEQAADATRQAAEQAAGATRTAASQLGDPATQEKARHTFDLAGKQAKVGLGHAKRGISTAIDRIDPNVLADMIIKATSLQERANSSLREKGSPYRVSEIGIAAAIPPQITFSIGRIDDPEPVPTGAMVASTALLDDMPPEAAEIVALDGSTVADLPEIGLTADGVAVPVGSAGSD
jgi:hypothetical protein